MKIKEVELETGLTRANIRFYESKELFIPERGDNNYREYSKEDVETLKKIVLFRKLGMSIENLQELFSGNLSLEQSISEAKEDLEKQIEDLRGALELCEMIQQNREQMDSIVIDDYLKMLNNKEKQGKKFKDIMDDILEEYKSTILEERFSMFPIKGNYCLGILVMLIICGIWLVILDCILNPNLPVRRHLEQLMIPVCTFFIVSFVYFVDRLIAVRNGKMGRVIYYIVLGIAVAFILGILGVILAGVLNHLGVIRLW